MPKAKTIKVKAKKQFKLPDGKWSKPGTSYEFDENTAKALVAANKAEPVPAGKASPAADK